MRSFRAFPAWIAASALATAACGVDDVPYRCTSDEQCRKGGVEGRCELTSYCSFPDADCDSGSRYASLAPETLKSRCVPPGCIEQITVGDSHACLRTAEEIYCWGDSARGKLGVRDAMPGVPALLDDLGAAVLSVTAGAHHTCALIGADYEVVCWGNNAHGQLGTLDLQDTGPLTVPGLGERRAVLDGLAAGGAHTCVFGDPLSACWGRNDFGQLGTGMTGEPPPGPVPIDSDFAEIALGGNHGCGRHQAGGAVSCWGQNERSQTGGSGNGVIPSRVNFPRLEMPLAAAELALGEAHSCARLTSGQVVCWGDNASGQIGLPRQQASSSVAPQPVTDLEPAVQITAGSHHTCALLDDGNVACWGENERGQLGPSAPLGPSVSTPVVTELREPAEEVRAGGQSTCALTRNTHTVYCWGSNEYGQLGNGAIEVEGRANPDPTLTRSVSCPF